MNTDCSDLHPLSRCQNTPDDMKKDLFVNYRAEKRRKGNETPKLSVVRERAAESDLDESKGRYHVVLEDEVGAITLGDYGADANALPLTMLHRLKKTVKELMVTPVNPPCKLSAAINSTATHPIHFTASHKVTLSVTIILPDPQPPSPHPWRSFFGG